MPWLFMATAFIFFILIPTGFFTKHILVFFIGLAGVGSSMILFALTATKKWSGYGDNKSVAWFFRLVVVVIGSVVLYVANIYYSDVRSYLDGSYAIITGVPSEIIGSDAQREFVPTITVVINNESFEIIPKAKYFNNLEALENKMFTIYYLPNTKWVIKHDVD